MKEIVTTLPITVRPEMTVGRMQTAITGSLLAHHIGADFNVWQGLNGRASDVSLRSQEKFSALALAYGPRQMTQISSDLDPAFVDFVQHSTSELMAMGHLAVKNVEQLVCDCGVVHIEKAAIEATRPDKLRNIKQVAGSLACIQCDSFLISDDSRQIVTTPTLYNEFNPSVDTFPQSTVRAKVSSVISEARDRQKTITRTARSGGIQFHWSGEDFTLDPDFSLLYTPSYTGVSERTTVVAGARQIQRVVGSVAIARALKQSRQVRALLHPRIFVKPDNEELNVIASVGRREVMRNSMVTAAALLWNNHESMLSEGDYAMVTKMVARLEDSRQSLASDVPGIVVRSPSENSIQSFMRIYSPQVIRGLLKNIRRGIVTKDSDEATLMADVLGLRNN